MIHQFNDLFKPQSVAVIGASDRWGSAGRTVFTHLVAKQVAPTIVPVNNGHKTVGGQKSYETLSEAAMINQTDMAIVILSANKLHNIINEAARLKIKYLIFINDLNEINAIIQQKIQKAAEQAKALNVHLLTLSVYGLLSFFDIQPNSHYAYIGQAVDIADCLKNYANERGIEFSQFITLNPQNYGISTGQIVDAIATQPKNTALLVHICVLDNARELVSALTAAARQKTVVVLLTLNDKREENLLYQALERNHIFTVPTLNQFFTAAKLIHTGLICKGKRLAMVSNSPQIGTLTLNALPHNELNLLNLSQQSQRIIGKLLPQRPNHFNPLYLPPESSPSVFQAVVWQILQDDNIDAVFFLFVGQNNIDNQSVAQMLSQLQKQTQKPLLLTWLGSADTPEIRQIFNKNKNLNFRQPEHALQALMQLNHHRQHHLQRQRLGAFHDYAHAAENAQNWHKSWRSRSPMSVLPTTNKYNTLDLLYYLQLDNALNDNATSVHHLDLRWEVQAHFGQVLHLKSRQRNMDLLPPITPEIASKALNHLGLPVFIWQDWLLNTTEILSRMPDIQFLSLNVSHNVKRGMMCHAAQVDFYHQHTVSDSVANIFTPYPHDYERILELPDGRKATLRPIRPEDATLLKILFSEQSEDSRYMRFMSKSNNLPTPLLLRLSNPDYQREFALIMYDDDLTPLATANYVADNNGTSCEFGISLADNLQGFGIGATLLQEIINHAQQNGFTQIRAEILAENMPMQKLALKLGFQLAKNPEDKSVVNAVLNLAA